MRLLEQARENLGDYKLKTASDYVVPEHQRVTTKKKRQQLLTLRAQVDTIFFLRAQIQMLSIFDAILCILLPRYLIRRKSTIKS